MEANATHLQPAVAALRAGHPVCLYDADGREEETDMVVASQFATPETIRLLRSDAGGLLCTTVAPEHHQKLGLPYLADLLARAADAYPVLAGMKAHDLKYDPSKSSFGLTVNSRATFTGIPDRDRSLTIQDLAGFLGHVASLEDETARDRFGARFRTPGHCILLNAAPGGLAARQGHTELATELMRQAGLVPSATICEMLDPSSGRALGKKAARAYAERNGLVFLTGQDVLEAWQATLVQSSQRPPRPAHPAGPATAPQAPSPTGQEPYAAARPADPRRPGRRHDRTAVPMSA